MEKALFCPLASGSDGNSAVCGFGKGAPNVLLDAGVSCARIVEKLKAVSLSATDIAAVFISHEHADHYAGAAVFSKRFGVPVYASAGTWRAVSQNAQMAALAPGNKKTFVYDKKIKITNGFDVMPFKTPHDALEPCGFNVFVGNKKISVLTDLGAATDIITERIADSDALLIESNHDTHMLKNGPYPYLLKKRILSDNGHLSNLACAEILSRVYTKRLKHVFLGHLSAQNNIPVLAYETVSDYLYEKNIRPERDFAFSVANRAGVSKAAYID